MLRLWRKHFNCTLKTCKYDWKFSQKCLHFRHIGYPYNFTSSRCSLLLFYIWDSLLPRFFFAMTIELVVEYGLSRWYTVTPRSGRDATFFIARNCCCYRMWEWWWWRYCWCVATKEGAAVAAAAGGSGRWEEWICGWAMDGLMSCVGACNCMGMGRFDAILMRVGCCCWFWLYLWSPPFLLLCCSIRGSMLLLLHFLQFAVIIIIVVVIWIMLA